MNRALVGDIGGTNARFALWQDGQPCEVQVLATADFPTLLAAIRHYLESLGLPPQELASACLACAGPVDAEEFRFTNNPWHFSRSQLMGELGLQRLLLLNDFAAMALGMTRLSPGELSEVLPGSGHSGAPRLVIGPGTGLGVSTLLPRDNGHWQVLAGEGGHVSLPIGNLREAALWRLLQEELEHVEAEAVISGGGLLRLYRASCRLDGRPARLSEPEEITTAALDGDAFAAAVLEQFCTWLGRVAGDAVLTLGARGGVYVVGGVVPRIAEFFKASGFAQGFRAKGRSSAYLQAVPVWLVSAPYPGLVGAGVALDQAG